MREGRRLEVQLETREGERECEEGASGVREVLTACFEGRLEVG